MSVAIAIAKPIATERLPHLLMLPPVIKSSGWELPTAAACGQAGQPRP
jgi:hypothetical protein